jgi:Subtilase family
MLDALYRDFAMTIRIFSGATWNPVGCVVREYHVGPLTGGEPTRLSHELCPQGNYDLKHTGSTTHLCIIPFDGHWSMFVPVASPNTIIRCPEFGVGEVHLPWWQRAVGVTATRRGDATNIKVGVIDRVFRPMSGLQHISLIDDPAHVDDVCNQLGVDQYFTHGQMVTHVLAGRGPGAYLGIAHAAKVYFADATYLENGRLVDEDSVSTERVLEAIAKLSKEYDVDLINISCGFYEQDFPDEEEFRLFQDALSDEIAAAAERGCLCICGGGNTVDLPVPVPAALNDAIGVGGIGLCGVGPSDSLMEFAEQKAANQGCTGTLVPGIGCFFHDVETSIGPVVWDADSLVGVGFHLSRGPCLSVGEEAATI